MPSDLQIIDGFEGLRSAFGEANPGVVVAAQNGAAKKVAHSRDEILSAWFTAMLGLEPESSQHRRWLRALVNEIESAKSGGARDKGLESLLKKSPKVMEQARKVAEWCEAQGSGKIQLKPAPASLAAESAAWSRALPGLTGVRVWKFMEHLGRPVVVPESGVRRFFWRLGLIEMESATSAKQLQLAAAAGERIHALTGFPLRELRTLLEWHTGAETRHDGGALCRTKPDCAPCSFKSGCAFFRFNGAAKVERARADDDEEESASPSMESVREQFDRRGVENLADPELFALLFSSGNGDKNLKIAIKLLRRFGGIRGIYHASVAELQAYEGIGEGRARQIKSALELGRRLAENPLNAGDPIAGSEDVYKAFCGRFSHIPQEHLVALMLDTKNRYMDFCIVSKGTLSGSPAHPREVFKAAIRQSASAIILMHNHPSGDPTPSSDDIAVTRTLIEAGKILGIRVLDHIILGQQSYFSFKDEGRM